MNHLLQGSHKIYAKWASSSRLFAVTRMVKSELLIRGFAVNSKRSLDCLHEFEAEIVLRFS